MTLLESDGKAALISEYGDRWEVDVMIETGTAIGDLSLLCASDFEQIVTIEMADDYYRSAVNRLLPYPHVRVIHGDSADWLGPVLAMVNTPAVVWLDAHEIADDGRAALRAEMVALAHDANMHVILIDDARLCSGRKGWMTVGEIEEWAAAYGYTYEGVTDDVARLVPR